MGSKALAKAQGRRAINIAVIAEAASRSREGNEGRGHVLNVISVAQFCRKTINILILLRRRKQARGVMLWCEDTQLVDIRFCLFLAISQGCTQNSEGR